MRDEAQLSALVHRLEETEAVIREMLGGDVDAVIGPISGVPLLLRQAQLELIRLHDELEDKVEERTAALQAANEELSALNQELATTDETLRRQNAELEAARLTIDRERARYQTLFDLAPDGYLVTDPDGTIHEANVAAGMLLGEASDRLSERKLVEFVFHADRRLLQDQLHRMRIQARWQAWRWEMRVQPATGRAFHAAVTAAPVRSNEGELIGIRWLLRDITVRKEAEAALVASEERLRLVADLTYDWEYWTGTDGQFIHVSPSAERITGYRAQEFFDDPSLMEKIVHPDDRHLLEEHRRDKEQERGVCRIDLRIVSRGGDVRWIGHACQAVYREDGTWLGRRGSNRDITERKQAEARQAELLQQVRAERDVTAALAARIEREWNLLETVMDNTATGLASLDPEFSFVRVNQAYAAQSRYHPAELIGRNHFDLFPNDENRAIFERVRDSGKAVEFKARAFEYADQPDRGVTYWDWTLVPVKDQVGEVVGLVLSLTEVTDKVHAARQQEQNLDRLNTLLACARNVVAAQTVEELLQHVIDAARELTGGRIGTAGHGYRDGEFVVAAGSRASGAPECPPGESFRTEHGGVYLHILDSPLPISLTDRELREHPGWWGLPDGHAPQRGLLGARLVRRDGMGDGIIMVTDKEGGEFTAEDAAVLGQLAAIASLALQHVEARHDAEQRAGELDAVFEAMVDSVIVYDAAGMPIKANRAALETHGLNPVGMDRQMLADAITVRHPDGSPVDLEETTSSRALRGERVAGEAFVYTTASGEVRNIVASGAPLSDDGGVQGAVVVWHDVTEQVRARGRIEEISAQAQQRADELDAVFDAMADAVVVVDASGVAVRANRAMIEACGEDPVGHAWAPYVKALAAHRSGGELIDPAELAGETVRELRFTITDGAGRNRTVLASGGPLRQGGEVTGAVIVWHDVTRLEQAERSRDQLVAILEETPDIVSTATVDGTIRYYNRAARHILGVPDDADVSSYVIPYGLPEWAVDVIQQEAIPAAVRDGVWQGRTATVSHDGTEIPVAQTVIAHRGPSGEVEYLSSVAHDMSREEAMMAQLEAERARLKTILDNAPEGIIVADDQARILFTNPAAERLYAHPVPYGEAYESHAIFQICTPDGTPYEPRDLPLTRSALDGEILEDLAMSIDWPDGQRRHLLVNTTPILGSDGRVTGAVGVFQDITERLEMQEALRRARDELEARVVERTRDLRESEERFRQLAEHIEDVFWLVDPIDGRLLYVSPAYEKVWGRPIAELYWSSEALLEGVHPDDRERVVEWLGSANYGTEHEFRILRPDGAERWIRSRAFPVRDGAGQTYRVAGIASDVTRQKQAQLAMIKTERLSMAGQMAASLAHEINNPLQGATGCLELMREALEEGEDAAHYVDVAYEALSRAVRTVAQLRSLHRGPLVEEKETANVNDLVEESLVLTRKKAAAQDVELVWTPGSDLPPIQLMRDGMHQVLLNLILNALDAMPGGGKLTVCTERVERPLGVRVALADTGPGVASDILDRLFEPFHTTKPEGTGLGLFVSQNTVERHGGQIEVDSTDRGATFTVWLPA